jgi:hypothetical protein
MRSVTRLVSDYACVHQSTSSPSVICNGVMPCPRTGSILGIYDKSVSGNHKTYFRQMYRTAEIAVYHPN